MTRGLADPELEAGRRSGGTSIAVVEATDMGFGSEPFQSQRISGRASSGPGGGIRKGRM